MVIRKLLYPLLSVLVLTLTAGGCSSDEKKTSAIPGVDFELMPKFSPVGGFYKEAQSVTIASALEGCSIYYTTDGSQPTSASTEYTVPFTVSSRTLIRAVAIADKESHYAMTMFDFDTTADVASHLSSPDWQDEVIYLALTDRFADGDSTINKQGCPAMEDHPAEESNFSGGDFQGLIDKLNSGYFTSLGITTIWVTPPVRNQWHEGNYGGYHGYWASDFTDVDPHFGDIAKYREFVSLAHEKGLRVVQDIVLNHVGDYFTVKDRTYTYGSSNWSLNAISEPFTAPEQLPWRFNNPGVFTAEELIYNSFYHWTPAISDFNDHAQIFDNQQGNLDDINTDNEVVQNLLRGYFRYWIDKADVDGYRIDTVKYIKPEFFEGFANATTPGNLGIREYAKSKGKNDFILFGEAWSDSDELCASYTKSATGTARMDSMIYFPLNTAIRNVFGSGSNTSELSTVLKRRYTSGYANPDKLVTFIDNHDMARFRSVASARMNKAAYAFIMTIPGIPQIYYGTEQEFTTCRRAMFAGGHQGSNMPTNTENCYATSGDMFTYLKSLITLRKANSVFRKGTVSILRDSASGNGIFAYKLVEAAGGDGKEALIVFNTANEAKVANNIETGFGSGIRLLLQDPSLGVTDSELISDANGKISLVVPAESFGIYIRDGSTTSPVAANSVTISSSYPDAITEDSITVSGTVGSTPASIMLFLDGNIGKSTTYSLDTGSATSWSTSFPLTGVSGGSHLLTAALDLGGSYVFSDSVSLYIRPTMKLSGSCLDPQGDDTGPSGRAYTLPTNNTFATHLEDILGVEVFTAGPDMEISVTMRDTSTVWAPTINNFDHVLFNIFIRKKSSASTVSALPLFNYTIPFAWDYHIKEEGWNSAMYGCTGASASSNGSSISPAPTSRVDHANHVITFIIPGSALGSPPSLSGWQIYIATWDADMGNPRGLTATGGVWSFGGGNGKVDPLVIDETSVITLD